MQKTLGLRQILRPAKKLTQAKSDSEPLCTQSLCKRCEAIPWKSLPKILESAEDIQGVFLGNITDSHDKLFNSCCAICQLLAAIKPAVMDQMPGHIRAFSGAWTLANMVGGVSEGNPDYSESVLIACLEGASNGERKEYIYSSLYETLRVPYGFLCITGSTSRRNVVEPRLLSPQVDFDILKNWLACCWSNHSTSCSPTASTQLRHFRVMDCDEDGAVVPAPSPCEYVALSYVWGSPDPNLVKRPNALSQVALDSLSVTRALGYRYLWIDQYCIDQNDSHLKDDQIQQMDIIYSAAQLTLIAAGAADGIEENANCGLHGVSRARTTQRYGQVGSLILTQIFPRADRTIQASKWSSRAWTYQENLFSKRRLFFTKDQVFFQCRVMYCSECFSLPCESSFGANEWHFSTPGFTQPFDGPYGDTQHMARNPHEAMEYHIYHFSQRRLTFEADVLNALLGVLHTLEDGTDPVLHMNGIPIWKENDDYVLRLAWNHERPTKRLQAFPSWSWTGWSRQALERSDETSVVNFPDRIGNVLNDASVQWSGLRVMDTSSAAQPMESSSLSFEAFVDDYATRGPTWPRYICMTAPLIDLYFRYIWPERKSSLPSGWFAYLPWSDNIHILWWIFMDNADIPILVGDKVTALLTFPTIYMAHLYVLLLRNCGEYYERIGIAKFRRFFRLPLKKNKVFIEGEESLAVMEEFLKWLELLPRTSVVLG